MVKKALMVIAPNDFRDEEFFETKEVLEKSNIDVTVVNSNGQPSKSMFGKIVTPDKNFYDVDTKDFDAIVFVGGAGTAVYHNHKRAIELAKEFYDEGKIVAAICIAPTILVNAGILRGKKATSWPSERGRITAVGVYTGKLVEVDGKIITGNGPTAAKEFGKKIVEVMK
jgi:protease I